MFYNRLDTISVKYLVKHVKHCEISQYYPDTAKISQNLRCLVACETCETIKKSDICASTSVKIVKYCYAI